jgi:hypothetical protein
MFSGPLVSERYHGAVSALPRRRRDSLTCAAMLMHLCPRGDLNTAARRIIKFHPQSRIHALTRHPAASAAPCRPPGII